MLTERSVHDSLGYDEQSLDEVLKRLGNPPKDKVIALIHRLEKDGFVRTRKPWFRQMRIKKTKKGFSESDTITTSVFNLKGGVGKTTTAVNIASILAENKKKVLLVDMDPQANATYMLGYENKPTVYEALIGEAAPADCLQASAYDGLFIMPSDLDLAGAEAELSGVDGATRLRKVISAIKGQFDHIIIDCPPSLSLLTLNALVASNNMIVPVECDQYAMVSLKKLEKTINLVKEHNPYIKVKALVLTKHDGSHQSKRFESQVRNKYLKSVAKSVIPEDEIVVEASAKRKPLNRYPKDSKAKKAYEKLVEEVNLDG